MLDKISNDIKKLLPSIYEFRWNIHEYPELGYNENITTQKIKDFLLKFGLKFQNFKYLAGGYVKVLSNTKSKDTVCFRCDIDALPIKEETNIIYSSKNVGKMHACGHDIHTSIGVGLAIILEQNKKLLKNDVIILFQSAEECSPTGGAKLIIKNNFLLEHNIDKIFGLHVWPSLKIGEIAIKYGVQMGASDRFNITIKGRSAHAAEPHKGIDAILISNEVINWLVYKLKREIDSQENYILSLGTINSTGRYNVICDYVRIEGTIRTISLKTRLYLHQRVKKILQILSEFYNCEIDIEILKGYDFVKNDNELTKDFIEKSKYILGEQNVLTTFPATMIGEDFSFYQNLIKGCYFFLGCESIYPLHSSKFLPKIECIDVALLLLSRYFLQF